jgi:flagellar hook assembly protein FlgD
VIYDLQGRRVRTVVDALRPAGPDRVFWDGVDDAGRRAASGTYLVRFEAEGVTSASKLTLVR